MAKRIIKFRIWDSKEKKIRYGIDDSVIVSALNLINKMVWQQFTGHKDKNGKEIYEGDILQRQEIETATTTGLSRTVVEDIRDINSLLELGHPVEVIGNIYETPTLLKF